METEDTVTFCQNDLITTSFACFQDMRKSGKFCDLTIRILERTIRAHRMVIVAAIPFFDSMVYSSQIGNGEVILEDLDPESLDILIDFAYTTKIKISTSNVQSLLRTSQLLQLHQVQEACIQFISQRLQIHNVLQVHDFAVRLKNSDLDENVKQFIKHNFQELSQCEYFVNLSYSCLKSVISADDLNISNEETVFEAILKWVKSTSKRHMLLPELLREVRLICLPIAYLYNNVSKEDLIIGSTPCKVLLDEVKDYHLMPEDISRFSNLKTSPRKSVSDSKCNQYLYAVFQRDKTIYINRCDFANKNEENLSSYSNNCFFYMAVCVNNIVYVFFTETVVKLDLKSMKWMNLLLRHKFTVDFAAMAHDNIIYCFGVDGNCRYIIKRFSAVENKWLPDVQMTSECFRSGVGAIENSIYITGGYDVGNKVTKYDIVAGKFCEVASMLDPRSSHGCTSMNEKIYVCGGFTSAFKSVCTAEVYDPRTNKWNYISSMKIPKCVFSLLSKDDQLYAIGGCSDALCKDHVRELEIYDMRKDEWTPRILLPEGGHPGKASYFFLS